jgi:hypothetical protein
MEAFEPLSSILVCLHNNQKTYMSGGMVIGIIGVPLSGAISPFRVACICPFEPMSTNPIALRRLVQQKQQN